MTGIRATFQIPYVLRLESGDYPSGSDGGLLTLSDGNQTSSDMPPSLFVSTVFQALEQPDLDQAFTIQVTEANKLVLRTNRFLRWYRAVSGESEVIELTRADASPIRFAVERTNRPWGPNDGWLIREATSIGSYELDEAGLTERIRAGFSGSEEPEVAHLFLLDARQAIRSGRFREAVLFCWSTIDSVFSRAYQELVRDSVFTASDTELRRSLVDIRIPMKIRMTAGMQLVANRSLHAEPNSFWANLNLSYTQRNNIIHRGANADEASAELALRVAVEMIAIMRNVSSGESES